jgi:hypothetical protein
MSGNGISNAANIVLSGGQPGVGWELSQGFAGLEYDVPSSIVGLGSNGNMRAYGHIFSVDRDPLTPPTVAQDMMIINNGRSTLLNGKQRLVGLCATDNTESGAIAYLSDIPVSRGSFSSSVTQGIVNTATPRVFTYTDIGTLVGITQSLGQIFSTDGGSYLLTFSIQFARTGGGGGGSAVAEAWIRVNGTDVPNTNSRVLLPSGSAESILTVPINIDLNAGDYVEVVYCATNANVVAEAFPARASPFVAPAVPSIIVNIDQVA